MKTIVITGASSGFGKRTVERLLESTSYRVVASLRGGETRGKKIFVESLLQSHQSRLFFWDLDFDQKLSVDEIQQSWKKHFNFPIDILINNAGYGMLGPAFDQSIDDLRKQFEVNFFAPVTLIHSLISFMPENNAKIINLSSICGLATFPFYGAYCSSKYALEAYTEGLHFECRQRGVQFCLVEPGAFKTEFNNRAKSEIKASTSRLGRFNFENQKLAFSNFITEKNNLAGNPEKVVQLILNLVDKNKIPLRKTIGPDALFLSLLKRYLPIKIWDFLIRLSFKKIANL